MEEVFEGIENLARLSRVRDAKAMIGAFIVVGAFLACASIIVMAVVFR